MLDVAGELDRHGAARAAHAQRGIVLGAVGQDGRHRGERDQVVDDRGLAEQALVRRQRRLGAHLAALAFEAFQQRGLLAADIGAGADAHFEVELGLGTQKTLALGQHDGALHDADGVGILRADVDVALGRADREACDRHALDQHEGIAFHDHAVGIGARIAFVGIADDVLPVGRRVGDRLPLDAGRKARAAAAAQARLGDLFDGRRGTEAPRPLQPAPSAVGAIVGQRQRIDDAAAGEGDARLLLEEGNLLGTRRRTAHGTPPAGRRRTGSPRPSPPPDRSRCGRSQSRPRSSAPARTGRASRCARSRRRCPCVWSLRQSPRRPCRRRRRGPRHRGERRCAWSSPDLARDVVDRVAWSAARSPRRRASPTVPRRRGPGSTSPRW